VLLRLSYLALTNVFALVRLLPMSDVDKDVEILALRLWGASLCQGVAADRVSASWTRVR
jgi:putative transposase